MLGRCCTAVSYKLTLKTLAQKHTGAVACCCHDDIRKLRAHTLAHTLPLALALLAGSVYAPAGTYIYIYIYIYADAQAVLYRSTSLRFFLCLSLSLSLSFCLSRSLNASTWPYVCSLTLAFIDLLMNPRAFGAFRAQGVCNQSSWLSWPHGCM